MNRNRAIACGFCGGTDGLVGDDVACDGEGDAADFARIFDGRWLGVGGDGADGDADESTAEGGGERDAQEAGRSEFAG